MIIIFFTFFIFYDFLFFLLMWLFERRERPAPAHLPLLSPPLSQVKSKSAESIFNIGVTGIMLIEKQLIKGLIYSNRSSFIEHINVQNLLYFVLHL